MWYDEGRVEADERHHPHNRPGSENESERKEAHGPMDTPVSEKVNRREVISAGLAVGAALVLAGCQASPKRARRPAPTRGDGAVTQQSTGSRYPTTQPQAATIATPSGVISRREWATADTIVPRTNPMGRISRITVHHDGMPPVWLHTRGDVAARIELIRRAHVNNGWADIGYHYIIDPQGNVWEGRPLRYQGAHVKVANESNLGILVLGNFMEQRPTLSATTALDRFVASHMRQYGVPLARVHTHQELSPTACPGVNLQRYMEETRSSRGWLARA